MTNVSKISVFATVIIVAILSLGAFATTVYADDAGGDDGWGFSGDSGGNDGWGYADTGGNDGWGYADPGTNDGWDYADAGTNDGWGYADLGENDGWGYGDLGENDGWGYADLGENDGWGYADTGCDYGCDTYDYVDTYDQDNYRYTPSYAPSYSQPRYSTPSYAQSYSAPRVVNPSYASYASASYPVSQPRTSQPVVQPMYQQQQQQTSRPQVTPININNVNTNTNTNVNTNTTPIVSVAPTPVYQSAPVYPVYQHPVYYPVQYTFPQTYAAPALSCVVTASPNSIQNGARALLTWSSYGATSAWLSDGIGRVAPSGSLSVSPNVSTSYTLTVTDWMGRTQSCTTFLAVSAAPYVSLSQIPYTGFDFGTFGNAIYWGGLLAFALSLAYLALYYVPGHLGFGGATVVLGTVRRTNGMVRSPLSLSDVTTPDLFGPASHKPAKARTQGAAPAVTGKNTNPPAAKLAREDRPVAAANAPKDAMNFVPAKEGEMPRIVIDRS